MDVPQRQGKAHPHEVRESRMRRNAVHDAGATPSVSANGSPGVPGIPKDRANRGINMNVPWQSLTAAAGIPQPPKLSNPARKRPLKR